MVALVLLAVFFAGVAVAGLRGWGVDTRDVRYTACWPARPRSPPPPVTVAHEPSAGSSRRRDLAMTTELVRFEHDAVRAPGAEAPTRRTTAAEVMSRFPVTVGRHTSLFAAWGELRAARARHLVVLDEGHRPVGVLDERDIALEWPATPLAAHHRPVHELLRFRARPRVLGDDDIAAVARAMTGSDTDAVPVVARDGRLLGLVTARHCVELVAAADAARARGPPRQGLRPHAVIIGEVATSSTFAARLARCRSISSAVASPASSSRPRICSTVARSRSAQAGPVIGKYASAETSTRPGARSRRGWLRP